MADKSYGIGTNLVIVSGESSFFVHKDVISQATPVWFSMLSNGWIESGKEVIKLIDDDSRSVMIALDIIYSNLLGDIEVDSTCIDDSLHTLVDKYDLKGVRNFISQHERFSSMKKEMADIKNHRSSYSDYNHHIRSNMWKIALMQSNGRNYYERPPYGRPVIENLFG